MGLVERAEAARFAASDLLSSTRVELGQFFTPAPTARLMAAMFPNCAQDEVRLLDAGAGVGTLTAAWIQEMCGRADPPRRIHAVAYEVDERLIPYLRTTMAECKLLCDSKGIEFTADVRNQDFLEVSVGALTGFMFTVNNERFDFAIVNPPYRKIRSDSRERSMLRLADIETGNLYSAFLSLIVRLLKDRGELVMISPRSFCNGPYFRSFRQSFLKAMAIRRIHIYESRSSAFKDDDVLQENVIVHAAKTPSKPRDAMISSSQGAGDCAVVSRAVQYSELVSPSDPDRFIHIPVCDEEAEIASRIRGLPGTLESLGISVSTGRVVEFRARDWIVREPSNGTAPLIYPAHLANAAVSWPRPGGRKPNAIVDSVETAHMLIPNDYYVLVKRFSSKEERRRVVAAVSSPGTLRSKRVGFENHLNYFHIDGGGLEPLVARGLALYLNSSLVDRYFRQFNGHTQVNAHDLRSLPYPPLEALSLLGIKSDGVGSLQSRIDDLIEELLPPVTQTVHAL